MNNNQLSLEAKKSLQKIKELDHINKKIAFADGGASAAARNTKLDSFKTTTKTGVFVPFSGKGYTLGNK